VTYDPFLAAQQRRDQANASRRNYLGDRMEGPSIDTSARAKHLAWSKTRALEYVDAGDVQGAFASMISDLNKHAETAGHQGAELGALLMMGGHLSTAREMREFIEGFN
jgi:hypothetical protein